MDLDALLDDPKAIVRLRVARSARPLIAERGLSVSMEEIAGATGLSRRSLFRYFDSRDALLAAVLDSGIDRNNEELAAAMAADLPFDEWLHGVVLGVYGVMQAFGLGLWQLAAAGDDDLSHELHTVNQRRRDNRRTLCQSVAREAWRRAGGVGACPPAIDDAVALTLSVFSVRSMVTDYDVSLDRLADASTALLSVLLRDQIDVATAATG